MTTHAVVLGGGLAGMLAASVLARRVDAVTVVDRDKLPDGPEFRKGVPQARHAHLLMSGGARVIERLLPGVTDRLLAEGAHRVGVPEQVVWLTAYGWQHRFPQTQFIISAGRPMLDWVVRDEVLRHHPNVATMPSTEALGPLGDANRIAGVRVRGVETGETTDLGADLVVDATGRGSQLKRWLAALGLPPVEQDTVDAGIAYATRIFRAPDGARAFPLVNVLADHRVPRPGRNASLAPIEGGRWIVTLSGTRGAEPPTDEDGFAEFARSMRDPLIADLIAVAEPLTAVQGSRSSANRRLYYERLPAWPEGLVALGDAVAAFNPVYGHGMSVAAHSAAALDEGLAEAGLTGGAAGRIQRAVGARADDAWLLAASQDLCYPNCRAEVNDPRLSPSVLAQRRSFSDLIGATALRDPAVSAAATKVTTLSEPISSLESPQVVTALRRAKGRPALSAPPLSDDERAVLRVGEPA
ncbi:FAD-dependent oxidoreductase [Dactylosporangium sp. NPDC051485]|uniref:FAD-dependent oxidoreductase n=1 Tax=Dactylosporangium sp. NPDC051485 TaxID=3154846 RepID=UPI0034486F84